MSEPPLSERDVCTKLITPAVERAGWDIQSQVREEVSLTAGRVMVRGQLVARGKAKRADYVLYLKPNLPLAVIEAKEPSHRVGDGMQQALEYAEMLGVPFAFSSNGAGFLFSDRTGQASKVETELKLDQFPSPDELWRRFRTWKGFSDESARIVAQDYYTDATGKAPRYYQLNAINAVVEAVARGQDRILLVMATGTGKTYTAFQIIWRLWKAGVKKRILFLADRNVLVDQTKRKDFKPFGGAMTKIENRKVDKSFEVYLALYQAITGTEESKDIFKQFSPEFFDLIVVDECHRGSAAAESAWREVLEYFSSATQLGLTATPKETEEISTSDYFGDPVYTYSLKQGIEDGFLAPYKVVRIDLDKDLTGWRPEKGKTDKFGVEIDDRVYNQKDFDRNLVLEKRTELVARKLTEFLAATGVYSKTIVFCEDIDHAERMRQAMVNANPELCAKNHRYVVRITGDSDEGKAQLDPFMAPEETYPVIATTSKLMSTGVDTETCRVIVLDQTIQSMTEFKQIIGRGTRIREDFGKLYFTILDFKKATELFADPGFDGDPVRIYAPKGNDPVAPPEDDVDIATLPEESTPVSTLDPSAPAGDGASDTIIDTPDGGGKRYKFVVDDVQVHVAAERVQYYGNDGKLITESLRDYTRRAIREEFASLDAFLKTWSKAERKKAILDQLAEHGVFFDALSDEVGKDLSPFDLVCHIAFDQPPLTRRERANNVFRAREEMVDQAQGDRPSLEGHTQGNPRPRLQPRHQEPPSSGRRPWRRRHALEGIPCRRNGSREVSGHAAGRSGLRTQGSEVVAAGKTTAMDVPVVVEQALGQGTFSADKFVDSFPVLVEAVGGIPKLRKLVLALALQGRLSKQIASNASTSDGLDDVIHDSSWRVEERPPKMKLDPKIEALVGVVPVPSGWVECRLNDCSQLINGRAYAQHELLSEGTPVIRIQNLNGGNDWYYSDLTLPDRQYCQNGDLLFAWSASFGPYIWSGPRAIYHYHIWKLNLSKAIDKRFLFFSLLHITDVVKEQSHGLAMLHMTKGQMERWPILLPPLAEQKRIVARVDQLMALIDQLEAKQNRKREVGARFTKASLEALSTAESPQEFTTAWTRILQNWETHFRGEEDVADLRSLCLWMGLTGRIGASATEIDSWEATTLGPITSMVTSGSRGWKEYYASAGAIFIRSQDIKTDSLDLAEPAYVALPRGVEGSRTRVQKDDLLVTITGANVGKAAHVRNDLPEAYVSQHVALIRLKEPLFAPWVHYWLVSQHNGRKALSAFAYGDKPGLNLDNIRGLPILLPLLAEQERIVAKVEHLMKLCDALEAALRRSEDRAAKLVEAVVQEMVA